jgi:hypothetical protein
MRPAIVAGVRVDDRTITFVLVDGRTLSAPTSWSRRLSDASQKDRDLYEIGGGGLYVEWPAIDEHIGVWTLLGVPEDEALEAGGFKIERARAS